MAKLEKRDTKLLYDAAGAFVDRALRTRDSVFTPGRAVWTEETLDDLHGRFVANPDLSDNTFEAKLRGQLKGAPPATIQLAAELLFVHLLPAHTTTGDHKRRLIGAILGWSDAQVSIPTALDGALDQGLAAEGMGFKIHRPFLLQYLLEFVRSWWQLDDARRDEALRDPWTFKAVAQSVNVAKAQSQREILLHLVHPDNFEPMMSRDHKGKIADAFARFAEGETDVDRRLLAIRRALQGKEGRPISFYEPKFLTAWQPQADPWGLFVRFAGLFYRIPEFDDTERNYKLRLASEAAPVVRALLANVDEPVEGLRRVLRSREQNIVRWQDFEPFLEWYRASFPASHEALSRLELPGATPEQRVREFLGRVPPETVRSAGARATLASFFMFVLDPLNMIVFRTRPFRQAYEQVNFPTVPEGADEASRYMLAIGFVDRFLNESAQRGLLLRDRLDAQGLVWAMAKWPATDKPAWVNPQDWDEFVSYRTGTAWVPTDESEETGPPVPPIGGGEELIEGDPVGRLLLRRKNVLLYGPPGTGKTHASLALADKWRRVHGSDSVLQVTFHPTFSYEDFVEGFRPDKSGRFECRVGVFRQACRRAQEDENRKVLLLIDEMNRGDVARIFGELITLIEADKRHPGAKRLLPYSQEELWVPPNLHLLGTMNTADRSISLLDVAIRRRFCFLEYRPDSSVMGTSSAFHANIGDVSLGELMDVLNRRLQSVGVDRDRAVGHSYFLIARTEADPIRALVERLRHDVIPLVEEYCYADRGLMAKVLGSLVTEEGSVNEELLSEEAEFIKALAALAGGHPGE